MPTHSTSHTATNTPSTTSINPTGWIRSTSTPRVLSDRTNLASPSKHPPPHSATKRTPKTLSSTTTTRTRQKQLKQPKLDSFFASKSAPPKPCVAIGLGGTDSLDSPSVARKKRGACGDKAVQNVQGWHDDELEARAANLLRRRFGSGSRSLKQTPPPLCDLPRRSSRLEPRASSPDFEATLMQQSLSDFTPPAWEQASRNKMPLLQRLAGIPNHEIFELQKQHMAHQLDAAHKRMQPKPPPTNQVAASCFPHNRASVGAPNAPKEVLRSPTTNRRIYALETQTLRSVDGVETTQDEADTLPLPWTEVARDDDKQIQPLAWHDPPPHAHSRSGMQVQTSDDEDLLLQRVIPSPSSSSSSSSPPSLSGSHLRIVNPVTLTPASGTHSLRFDHVVAALRKQERRRNAGMQLSLASLVSSARLNPNRIACAAPIESDLHELVSDDEQQDDEQTQPLAWPCSQSQTQLGSHAQHALPVQPCTSPATQHTSTSSTSAGVSLPTESNLYDTGDSQLRTFFHQL